MRKNNQLNLGNKILTGVVTVNLIDSYSNIKINVYFNIVIIIIIVYEQTNRFLLRIIEHVLILKLYST